MKKKRKVVTGIPVYKPAYSSDEEVSLKQCFRILGNHPLCLITSYSLDATAYEALAKECGVALETVRFPDHYFTSLEGYNALLMSPEFYQRFSDSEFLLIHQTDVYVFRDELLQWCNSGYDYIGAPWLFNMAGWPKLGYNPLVLKIHKFFGYRKLKRVGNGGLSLRRTDAFLRNLLWFRGQREQWKMNEDTFFAHCIGLLNPFFRIAPAEVALKFAFDANPQEALQLNQGQLPFGCHAFYRNDTSYEGNRAFWSQYIQMSEV